MQFLFTISVLAAIFSAESAGDDPLSHAGCRLTIATLALFAVWISAHLIARRFIRLWQSETLKNAIWLQRLDRAQRYHAGFSLLITIGILFSLDWAQLIRVNSGFARLPLVNDFCLLLPTVLPLLLSWQAYYRIDVAIAKSNPTSSQPESLSRYLCWQTRQHLAPLLVPAIGLLVVEDVLESLAPGWSAQEASWIWGIPGLLFVLVGFPFLLRRLWKTEKLADGPLKQTIEETIADQKLPIREVFIWHTGGRMINAAVTGFLPRMRYIFLTDALLARFSTEQVTAVLAHELGHVRGRHLLLRVLAMVTPALFLMTMTQYTPIPEASETAIHGTTDQIANAEQDSSPSTIPARLHAGFSFSAGELLLPIGLLAYAGVVLGRYSRFLELEADYLACCPINGTGDQETRSGRMSISQTENFLSMLAQLAASADSPPEKATWLHPSLTYRGSFLLTLLKNPAAQIRFEKRARRSRELVMTTLALGILVYCVLG